MLPPLVADVNIASRVVQFLRSQGVDVVSAFEEGWHLYKDEDILTNAHLMDRFVLTHDSDFGHLCNPPCINFQFDFWGDRGQLWKANSLRCVYIRVGHNFSL